jgi:hypothetical protein
MCIRARIVRDLVRYHVTDLVRAALVRATLIRDGIVRDISNNPSFHQKHPAVPDGSDGSNGTSYPLMENHMHSVAQATDWVAFILP